MENLVKKVSKVARISVSDDEVKTFTKDFQEVLDMFDSIDCVSIKENPTFHPIKTEGTLREDMEKEGLTKEESLSNTKNKNEGFFKGPGSL